MSKKKERNWMVIVSVIVAVAFLLFAANGFNFQAFVSGFTVKSISLANPPVQGQTNTWIVDVVTNGFGQSISGNLDKTDIKYSGATSTYPLSITGQISSNDAFYPINNENPKTVYKYLINSKVGSITDYVVYKAITPAPACDSGTKWDIDYRVPAGWLGLGSEVAARLCVTTQTVGTVAPISATPSVTPKVDVTITVNGQSQVATLQGTGIQTFTNGQGSVSWVNSPLQSGSTGAISIGNQYYAFAPVGGQNWKVIYANDYIGGGTGQAWSDTVTSTESDLNTLKVAIIDPTGVNCGGFTSDNNGLSNMVTCLKNYMNTKVSTANNLADNLINKQVSIKVGSVTEQTSLSSMNGQNGFLVDLGNIYAAAPELVFRINSGWIGIQFPNGIPQVTSATGSPNPFKSGEPFTMTINVNNIGTGTGSFIAQGVNCGLLQPPATFYPISVPAGGSGVITFVASTTGSNGGAGTCSGQIADTGSGKTSPFTVSYLMQSAAQCTEGQKYWYGGSVIKKCVNGVLVDDLTCQYGVTSDNGVWVCSTSPNPCTLNPEAEGCKSACAPIFGFIPDVFCEAGNWFNNLFAGIAGWLQMIGILLAVLVFFVALLLMRDVAAGKSGKVDALGWVITLAIASVLAYLAYTLWWLGLIVFIVLAIIKSLAGGWLKALKGGD